jgi:alkylation response protein AidB-like acyl-CoA dehydrogenase
MRFALDTSRLDFGASIDAMLAAADVPGISRALAAGDVEPTRTLWKSLGDIGVTGLLIDAEFGGLDAEPLDLVVALERMGKWGVPGPVVESIAAAPALLGWTNRTGNDCTGQGLTEEWLTGLASGDLVATVAIEPHSPYVLDPHVAGLSLLVREGAMSTATVTGTHRSVDPSRTLGIVEPGTAVTGADAAVQEGVREAELRATLGCAAQLLGAGRSLLTRTVDYAKVRQQFGRPIGSYQAIKHQLADVMVELELAAPLLYNAALSLAAHPDIARRDVSAAKVACGDAAYRASRTALQVHGAIGYTAEFDLSLWITKVRALQSSWGTASVHRRRILEVL